MTAGFLNHPCRLGFLGFSAALILCACAGNGEGLDTGGRPIADGGASSDFQEIQDTIFTPVCTACHVGAGAPQGLRLDVGNSYALLVNVASAEVPGLLRVNPGNPDLSYLVQKIEGSAAVGVRMPANGPPYLPQDRIDLVRSWIAAGAPMATTPTDRLTVTSTVPAASETTAPGLGKITVVFNAGIDASHVSAETFELRDALDEPVALATVRVPPGRPNVVELHMSRPLAAGSFQLTVRGDGPAPLADNAGHVLDGDADGTPGGDALVPFDVSSGASR
jgi:hypothetical protein